MEQAIHTGRKHGFGKLGPIIMPEDADFLCFDSPASTAGGVCLFVNLLS